MQDSMNVWVMLWLNNYSGKSALLIADQLFNGHNRHDTSEKGYFVHYERKFNRIYKATELKRERVCTRQVVFPLFPPIPFLHEGKYFETKCSLAGPSSLFQRWNYQIRLLHGLFGVNPNSFDRGIIHVLLISRTPEVEVQLFPKFNTFTYGLLIIFPASVFVAHK